MDKSIEYIEIRNVRVYTKSVTKAARVAARIKKYGGHGVKTIDGEKIKWESLSFAKWKEEKKLNKNIRHLDIVAAVERNTRGGH